MLLKSPQLVVDGVVDLLGVQFERLLDLKLIVQVRLYVALVFIPCPQLFYLVLDPLDRLLGPLVQNSALQDVERVVRLSLIPVELLPQRNPVDLELLVLVVGLSDRDHRVLDVVKFLV